MTPNQETHLDQVASDVRDIRMALLGNPLLSDGGLVGRVTTVEDELKKVSATQSNWKAFTAGMAFIIGATASFFSWVIATIWTKHN